MSESIQGGVGECAQNPPGKRFLGPILLAASTLVLSVHVTFSAVHVEHNADSVVPVLMSTVKWTPFYWGQNRLGALVPLLAMPFRNGMTNLLVQSWVTAFAGLAALLLLPSCILGSRVRYLAGFVAAGIFFGIFRARAVTEYLSIAMPYAVSLGLLAGALLLQERASGLRGMVASFAVFVVAYWVNIALFPLVFALVLLKGVVARNWRRTALDAGILTAAFLVNYVFAQLSRFKSDRSFAFDLGDVGDTLGPLCRGIVRQFAGSTAAVALFASILALLVIVVCIPATRRRMARRELALAGMGLAATVGYLMFLASLEWVKLNGFHFRYTLPVIVMTCALAGALVDVALSACVRGKTGVVVLRTLAAGALCAALVVRLPHWSLSRVRAAIDKQCTHAAADIDASRVRVVYGDFRDVWPAVFHCNLRMQERGDPHRLLGITDRCEATEDLWRPVIEAGNADCARIARSRWPPVPPENKDRAREAAYAAPLVFVPEREMRKLVVGRFVRPASVEP